MRFKRLASVVLTATFFLTCSLAHVSSIDAYVRVKRDSGGVPHICHYYDDGRYEKYTFKCYNDMGIRSFSYNLNPLGPHVSKTIDSSHRLFNSAKNSVDDLESNLNNATTNLIGTVASVAIEGGAVFTKNVRAMITAGIAVGVEGYATYSGWLDAKESLRKAYGYINHM